MPKDAIGLKPRSLRGINHWQLMSITPQQIKPYRKHSSLLVSKRNYLDTTERPREPSSALGLSDSRGRSPHQIRTPPDDRARLRPA